MTKSDPTSMSTRDGNFAEYLPSNQYSMRCVCSDSHGFRNKIWYKIDDKVVTNAKASVMNAALSQVPCLFGVF